MLDALVRDGRFALRSLLRRPAYALLFVATLAIVIGAASAVVAVVSATMVRPLPFPAGERLVQVFAMPPGRTAFTDRNPLDTRMFVRFRASLPLVEALDGIWARDRALDSGDGEPESVTAGGVSAGIFALFGGQPLLGRTFTEEEDRADAKLVILGHGVWQRRFGADPAAIGRTVTIDREPHVIVGVMPPGFAVAYTATEVWTPLHAAESGVGPAATFIQTFARVEQGVAVPQLTAALEARMKAVVAEVPTALAGWTTRVTTLRDAQFGAQQNSLLALLGAVIALALIACANLANLTLAQATARRSEWALRAALGGGRAAILRLQVVETGLLAGVGYAAGLLTGSWALPALRALDPVTARTLGEIAIDWRVVGAMGVLTLLVALFSGVLPIVRELRGAAASSLADGNRRAIGSRREARTRQWLVASECALAVVLLACGAVLVSAFERTARVAPGFDPTNVLGAQMRVSAAAYPTEARRADFISRVLERVRAIPGVIGAASTLNTFTPGNSFVTLIDIDGQPTADGQQHTVQFRRVSGEYFKTMRIPFVSGRDFSASDTLETPGSRSSAGCSPSATGQAVIPSDGVSGGVRRDASSPLSASSKMCATSVFRRRRHRRSMSASRRTTSRSRQCLWSCARPATLSAARGRSARRCWLSIPRSRSTM
jgi:putative ABC transport system permease protein